MNSNSVWVKEAHKNSSHQNISIPWFALNQKRLLILTPSSYNFNQAKRGISLRSSVWHFVFVSVYIFMSWLPTNTSTNYCHDFLYGCSLFFIKTDFFPFYMFLINGCPTNNHQFNLLRLNGMLNWKTYIMLQVKNFMFYKFVFFQFFCYI